MTLLYHAFAKSATVFPAADGEGQRKNAFIVLSDGFHECSKSPIGQFQQLVYNIKLFEPKRKEVMSPCLTDP